MLGDFVSVWHPCQLPHFCVHAKSQTFLPTMWSLGGQVTSLTGSTYNLRLSSRRSFWASMDTVRRHATASHPPDTWDALPLIANNARMRAARPLAIPARILFVHLLARSTVTPSESGRGSRQMYGEPLGTFIYRGQHVQRRCYSPKYTFRCVLAPNRLNRGQAGVLETTHDSNITEPHSSRLYSVTVVASRPARVGRVPRTHPPLEYVRTQLTFVAHLLTT